MVSAIASILKAKIGELPWVERYGGLVNQAIKPQFITGEGGVQIPSGALVYPVACEVNEEQCWENGKFKYFVPDSTLSAVAFFVDNGGIENVPVESPKGLTLRFSFNLKFLCWLNLNRLGQTDCNYSAKVAPYFVAKLFGQHSAVGVFGGSVEEEIYKAVTVTKIKQLVKNPSVFDPFTFAKEGSTRGLFLYPYDYLAIQVIGTFDVNKGCLPDYEVVPLKVNGTPIFNDEICIEP